MALVYQTGGSGGTGSENTASVTFPANSVCYVAAAAAQSTSTSQKPSISVDSASLDWFEVATQTYGGRRRLSVWRAVNTGAEVSEVITLTCSNVNDGVFQEVLWVVALDSAADTADPDDAAQVNEAASGTTLSVASVGTIGSDQVLIAGTCEGGAENLSVQAGSTELGIQEGGTNVRSLILGVSTSDDTPGIQWDSSNSAAAIGFIVNAAADSEYSANGSTGIQNYIGFQASQIGLHRNVTPGIAEFNAVGFAPATSSGFQIDAVTGYANAVGFGAQAIYDSVGISGRINFNTGTHQTHVTRQFFGLLGQLRALGFLVDQTNSQGFFPNLGSIAFQGPAGATVTIFAPPTTFTASALLRETHFVGFQAQTIREFFPISANTHALGFTPQYVEFIKEITGPDQGQVNFSGFQAQAIILGQINDAIAQRGQVNLVGFQHAVDMWRTLDSLQGRINMQGFAAGIALFQGGTINLSGLTGEINFDTLQQAIGMYRTFYPDSGLTNAEGYVPVPSTGTLVQSIVGLLNQEGFVPFIVAERYRGIVGEMRLEGFAPTIGGGLWTPKRRRATSWAAIN